MVKEDKFSCKVLTRLWIIACVALILTNVDAQDQHFIDSIQNEIKKYDAVKLEKGGKNNEQADTNRIDLLYQLCTQYIVTDVEKVKQIAEEIIQRSLSLKYASGLADGYTEMGIYYNHLGDYSQCIQMHERALDAAKGLKDEIRMMRSYNELGIVYSDLANYSKALEYHFAELKIGQARHDTEGCVSAYANIGVVYLNMNNNKQSLTYLNKELELLQKSSDLSTLAGCYINMGLAYNGLKNDSAALEYYFKGLELCEQSGNKFYEANDYSNIGAVYVDRKEFDNALAYFDKAINLFNEVGVVSGYISTMQSSAEAWFGKKQYQQSLNCLNKIANRARSMGAMEQLSGIYQSYAKNYEALNDYKNAYRYQVLYKQTSDSILSSEKLNNIHQMQLQFEVNRQELQDSVKMEETNYNSKLKLQRQRSYAIGGASFAAAIIFIGLILFRNKKQLEKQRALIEERSRISRELHDDVGSTLSSIRMMSEIGKKKLAGTNPEALQTLENIGLNSGEIQDKMGDLVWALQSDNEKMDKVIARIRKFAGEITEATGVTLIFDSDDFTRHKPLPVQVRQNIYLVAKEAINNAMKYSHCLVLRVSLKMENKKLTLVVKDNGNGFDLTTELDGNGLRTMQKRADEIAADLNINSSASGGTTVRLVLHTT